MSEQKQIERPISSLGSEIQGIAKDILNCGAFQYRSRFEGGFRLKLHEKNPEAPLSPFLLNLRTPDNPKKGPLNENLVGWIGEQIAGMIKSIGLAHAHVVGVPRAGDPIAKAVHANGVNGSLITLIKDESGEKRRIVVPDGMVNKYNGDAAVAVDDLITRADSKFEALAAMEAMGLRVTRVFVLVDRKQGGKEQLAEKNYVLHSLFTIHQLLDFYLAEKSITREVYDEIVAYLAAA